MHIIMEAALYLLAIYGLIMLAITVAGRIGGAGGTKKRPGVRVVLLVKDAEEQIEFIVRNAVKNDIASKVLSDNSLAVVDMNSSDNTYSLLEKLQKDFSCVEAIKYEDRTKIFQDYSIF